MTDTKDLILWPPDAERLLTGKDPDAGKDRRQKEKVMAEDKMITQPHGHNRHDWSKL